MEKKCGRQRSMEGAGPNFHTEMEPEVLPTIVKLYPWAEKRMQDSAAQEGSWKYDNLSSFPNWNTPHLPDPSAVINTGRWGWDSIKTVLDKETSERWD